MHAHALGGVGGGAEGEEENLKQTPERGAWGGVGGLEGLISQP